MFFLLPDGLKNDQDPDLANDQSSSKEHYAEH